MTLCILSYVLGSTGGQNGPQKQTINLSGVASIHPRDCSPDRHVSVILPTAEIAEGEQIEITIKWTRKISIGQIPAKKCLMINWMPLNWLNYVQIALSCSIIK